MKRQGIEGFTFDSEAEEWAQYATEARHSPAQPQNTPEIGEGSGRGDKAPVWPLMLLAALAFVGVVSIGKSVGWW